MSSYFNLILDTTPPILSINSPNYTTVDEPNDISISSNETLLNVQEIYIVDSLGNRHDLSFTYSTNEFSATITLSDYPTGDNIIYARLTDSVGNQSSLVSSTIKILDVANHDFRLSLSVSDAESIGMALSESVSSLKLTMIEKVFDLSIGDVDGFSLVISDEI